MSFICDACHEVAYDPNTRSVHGVKPVKFIVETREKVYTETRGYGSDRRLVEVARGSEIVREENLCPKCVTLVEETER